MLSREAMTQASHDYWLTMAEFWFKLAQHVEESKAISGAVDRSAYAASPKSKGMGKSK